MIHNTALSLLAETDFWVYLLPTIGSMMLFYGIFQVISESKSGEESRVKARLRGERAKPKEDLAETIVRRGAMREAATFADSLIGKFKFVPRLQTLIDQADLDWSAAQTLMNISGAAVLAALGLWVSDFGIFPAVGCGAAMFILPLMWIGFRKRRRLSKLAGQLPDVFEMMSQALRAGHSLGGAIQLIYEQMPPPVATEFAQVYHEQNLGIRVEDALQSMADRVDSLDVSFFVTAVLIQRQTGGDLAEVLDNISGVIRERIELAGLVRGLTAEGRLSGWVLFALPGIVFAGSMMVNPDYARVLLEDPRGQTMLMLAVGMQLMGIAMIRWIVNIKV